MRDMRLGIDKAVREAEEEQPWDGYYLVRGIEMTNLIKFAGLNSFGRVLDVGCGNGFIAYLMSLISKEVIATDLYAPDTRSHTVGIESARRLFLKTGSRNIPLLSCSIEQIPFKDDSFDVVFSSYTLHYLKDRAPALNELRRVVKKDGLVILMVPNFIERIYAFFQFYLYFAVKFFKLLKKKISEKKVVPGSGEGEAPLTLSKIKENYKYFPFPGPHGAYKNSFEEMISHMPSRWNREFNKAGLYAQSSFTTTFVPYPLFLTISLRLARIASLILEPFTRVFGNKPFTRYFGYNYCVILKK